MDYLEELDIGYQEVTVKNRRVKKTGSKIFQHLLKFLHSGQHQNVLQFTNNEKTEFKVKLIDKKSKEWSKDDLSLFLALDSLSCKNREQKGQAEQTKNRFKSNMRKLESSGYVKYLEEWKTSKAVLYKKYRILKECPFGAGNLQENYRESTYTKDILSSEESPVEFSFNVLPSHYSCLSGESVERYKNITDRNGESNNILPLVDSNVNEEATHNIAGTVDQNLFEGNQYMEKPNCNILKDRNINYKTSRRINVESEVNQNNALEVNENGTDINQYMSGIKLNRYITDRNGESNNILPLVDWNVNEEANHDIAGTVDQNLFEGNQYMEKPNCNIFKDRNINYKTSGRINVESEVNQNNALEGNENGTDINQYMTGIKLNRYITDRNGESNNILPLVDSNVNEEANHNIAGTVDQNVFEGNQYMEKPNCNIFKDINYKTSEGITGESEMNQNNALEVNENGTDIDQYMSELKCDNFMDINYETSEENNVESEVNQNNALEVNEKGTDKDQYMSELKCDVTMFEEIKEYDDVFKNDTNPLLSSTVVVEKHAELSFYSDWPIVYNFQFPENM